MLNADHCDVDIMLFQEQYKLCYSAVLEYIRQSDVYMNV